jgi:hypothetical protein
MGRKASVDRHKVASGAVSDAQDEIHTAAEHINARKTLLQEKVKEMKGSTFVKGKARAAPSAPSEASLSHRVISNTDILISFVSSSPGGVFTRLQHWCTTLAN